VDAALARALAKDPADRFATPREFIEACAPSAVAPSRRRWPVVAAVLGAVVLAAVTLPLWLRARTDGRERKQIAGPRAGPLRRGVRPATQVEARLADPPARCSMVRLRITSACRGERLAQRLPDEDEHRPTAC
jgi:hypothetical protein